MARIGLDIRMLGTGHGGIGRYVLELAVNVLKLDGFNDYFLFFNENNTPAETLKFLKNFGNARLIKTGIRHYSFGEQLKFGRILSKCKLDLAHFPNFNVPLFYPRPFVVTIHDVVHHKLSGAKKSRWFHFLAYKKIITSAVKRSKKIITVSKASAGEIAKYFQINPQKIAVVYEGSSFLPEISEAAASSVKKKFGLARPYFLFVGVLERKKNLTNLTRGFDRFIEKYKCDMDLVIAGRTDPHYPKIRHQALDIKNSDRLIFTGFVEDSDLQALYHGGFAFVSASLHEGYGLPGVEAMSFGLPLAVADTPAFNEIYDNSAVYFDPLNPDDIAEKLYFLVKDKLYYERLQSASLQRSRLFDWQITAKKTLEIYKECLNGKIPL